MRHITHHAKKNVPVAILIAFALLVLVLSAQGESFRSVEVKFSDASPSGLSIVPASCPSNPHVSWSECDPTTCTLWVDSNPIVQGNGTYLRWSSTNATSFYLDGYGFVDGSGATWVGPSQSTTYNASVSSYISGGSGTCSVTLYVNRSCALPWGGTITHGQSATAYQASTVPYGSSCVSQTRTCNDGNLTGSFQYSSCTVGSPAATCSVSFDTNPINQPNGTYLRWSSANASTVYIYNVGYVGSSGAAWVAPSQTTSYGGWASGAGGSNYCSGAWTLYVNRSCALPWGGTITHGQSATAYQKQNVGFGKSCTSETRTCYDGSLSGSYAYASCTVAGPSSCTFNGQTVAHGSSVTAYQSATVGLGQSCVSQSRTCSDGSLSGSYPYSSCSCVSTPSTVYSCSPQNVVRTVTNSSCGVTVTNPYATCTSPSFCSAGSSTCLYPPISYTPSGDLTGHLQIRPEIVASNTRVHVHWSVDNVITCSISGTNGDSWSGAAAGCDGESCYAGASGKQSSPIVAQTIYTMQCTGFPGTTPASITESATVNLAPIFEEQ